MRKMLTFSWNKSRYHLPKGWSQMTISLKLMNAKKKKKLDRDVKDFGARKFSSALNICQFGNEFQVTDDALI
jgi:hypothetical protein